ncbi:caspase domain-containing protein [Streptomyces sp. NPDC058464]|uniref:caspase family protein n=1 Tax=Streptomyces sp. NPDC058464 TaxID=3346511 RepID=UPI00366817E4
MRLPDPQRSYAVLIGTGTYRSDRLPDLPAVGNNLQDLSDILTDPALGGLPAERCLIVPDPSDPRTLFRTLRRYAAAAEDTFLVYFTGHGQTGPRNELYLSLAETVPDELKVSALAFDLLRDVLADCPAANRVVILDCCFSGRAIQDMAGEENTILGQVGIEGTYVLTSTPVNAVALAPTGAAHTAFTGELLRLLRTGIPSGPEFLTYGEIYRRLLHTATARGLPLPRQRGTGTADLLALSRNPAVSAASAGIRPVVPPLRTGPEAPRPTTPSELPWPVPPDEGEVRGGDPRLLRVAGRLFLLAMFLSVLPSLAASVYDVMASDYSVVTSVEEWQRNASTSVVPLADLTVPAFYLLAGVVTWRLCAQRGKIAWSGAAVLMVYGLDVAGGVPSRLSSFSENPSQEFFTQWDREVEIAGYILLGIVLAAVAFAIVRMRPPARLQRPVLWRTPAAATALTLAAAGLYLSARLDFDATGWSTPLTWVVTGVLTSAAPLAALLVRPVELASGLVGGWLAVVLYHEIFFWSFAPSAAHGEYLWLGLDAVALLTVLWAYLKRSAR